MNCPDFAGMVPAILAAYSLGISVAFFHPVILFT